jgi:hypothetical protein
LKKYVCIIGGHLGWFSDKFTLHVRPMKIDIMFLVPARMGFICRTKIFHYSLFLKNRLNKTPNWSPDQSLIAAFRKCNSNCIFLKTLLARTPLFFMSALVCVEIYCRVGRIKLLTSRIQIQKIMKNEKWKNPAPNFWKLWTRNMISIFIGLIVKKRSQFSNLKKKNFLILDLF